MLHNEWVSTLLGASKFGKPVAPTNPAGATREHIARNFYVNDSAGCLLDVPARKLNFKFAVAEAIWMATGRSDVESLTRYNSVMKNFSDDGLFLTGAYGPHLVGGLTRIIRKLTEDPFTRQAVLQIPRPQRYYTKDEPCTLSMQFLVREGRLNSIVTMRSSDVWLGIPYDVFSFAFFQNCLAGRLGHQRGFLLIQAGSQHLYERNLEDVERVFGDDGPNQTIWMPALPGFPPQWLEDVLASGEANDQLARELTEGGPWAGLGLALMAPNQVEARRVLAAEHIPGGVVA